MQTFYYHVCPQCTQVFKDASARDSVVDAFNGHKCSPTAGKTMSPIEEREWAVTHLERMGGVAV